MRILFTRHGESTANIQQVIANRGLAHPLTLWGRQQALELAEKLAGQPIACIYSSPLLRAVETSVLLAQRLQVDYEVVDALREYDCGEIEGRSDDASWQRWRELLDAWMVRGEHGRRLIGGESYDDIRARFLPFFDELGQTHAGTDATILCVAHGGLYLTMLPLLLGNLSWQMLEQHGFRNTGFLVAEQRIDGWRALEWDGEPLPD